MTFILHSIGKIDAETLKKYEITIPKIKPLKPIEIRNIRENMNLSQPAFAQLLNISPETIKKWEHGERQPMGASLKLLNLVQTHGLQALY